MSVPNYGPPPIPPVPPSPPLGRPWWHAAWVLPVAALIVGLGLGGAGASSSATTKTVAGPTITTAGPTVMTTVTATPTVIKTVATKTQTVTVTYTPPPPPPPHTLLDISGSGAKNTQDFKVTSDEWVVHYSYDCSNFGGTGNFAIDVSSTDGGDADGDTAANELKASATSSSTEHGSGTYYLSINSECDWRITVTQ